MSLRRTCATVATVATALTLGVSAASSASAVAVPTIPSDCGVATFGVQSDNSITAFSYANGTQRTPGAIPSFGFTPQALVLAGEGAGEASGFTIYLVVDPAGNVINWRSDSKKQANGTWTTTVTKKTLATNWLQTRDIALVNGHLFRLSEAGGLYRYNYTSAPTADGTSLTGGTTVGTNWQAVKNIVGERRVTIGTSGTGATRYGEVLLANQSVDVLSEYTIPIDTPTAVVRKDLKSSGWAQYDSIATGRCSGHPGGRVIMAMRNSGLTQVVYDANASDGSGADLTVPRTAETRFSATRHFGW